MIILSQYKDSIINFENVKSITIGTLLFDNKELFKILCNAENDIYNVGIYETEERAKEVLKEIVEDFIDDAIVYEMPEK